MTKQHEPRHDTTKDTTKSAKPARPRERRARVEEPISEVADAVAATPAVEAATPDSAVTSESVEEKVETQVPEREAATETSSEAPADEQPDSDETEESAEEPADERPRLTIVTPAKAPVKETPLAAEPAGAAPAERTFTKAKLIKLAREKVWYVLIKRGGLPLAKPGSDVEGVRLFTSDEGNGAVYITHRLPGSDGAAGSLTAGGRARVDERVVAYQGVLTAAGLPVERVEVNGVAHLRVPVTRTATRVEEPRAARALRERRVEETFTGGEGI